MVNIIFFLYFLRLQVRTDFTMEDILHELKHVTLLKENKEFIFIRWK